MNLSLSKSTVIWVTSLLVALIAFVLLADTEQRYLRFIKGLDDVEVELAWVGTDKGEKTITLRFEALFRNRSDMSLSVEALNTQLSIDGKYMGAFNIAEGEYQVPSQGERALPLDVVFWEDRAETLREASASERTRLHIDGRARARLRIGTQAFKAFYDVEASFPVQMYLSRGS